MQNPWIKKLETIIFLLLVALFFSIFEANYAMEKIAGTPNSKVYMKIFYNIVHSMSSAYIDENR